MHGFNMTPTHDAPDLIQVPDVYMSIRKGREVPFGGSSGNPQADAIARLECLIASCPDVEECRFDAMTVFGNDGHLVRKVDVHATVQCRGYTVLTNVHLDGRETFWATALLQAAACQLGFVSHLVTPLAVECSPSRFTTLMAVACRQDVDLTPTHVGLLAGVFDTTRRPRLGDVYRALGGGSIGRVRALAAVGQGLLRLGEHSDLTPTVLVARGPMLEGRRWPDGGAAPCSAAVGRDVAA